MVPEADSPKPSLESSDPVGELERLATWFKNHGSEQKAKEILEQIKAIRAKYTSTKQDAKPLERKSQS
jgi:hypothetical protein